jgi:hypothetical protein
MWCCVDLALTDVLEERIASIFRVEESARGNQREQVAADFETLKRYFKAMYDKMRLCEYVLVDVIRRNGSVNSCN